MDVLKDHRGETQDQRENKKVNYKKFEHKNKAFRKKVTQQSKTLTKWKKLKTIKDKHKTHSDRKKRSYKVKNK
ncbi:hypothetical protein HYD78_00960 [Mycoplasmopsis bovis]|nr:hypothetical protein [Mycoplasmopsis bovis]QQH43254.1 hypothetical protein HYD78_00960 [Mycoplasmopsis bovis]